MNPLRLRALHVMGSTIVLGSIMVFALGIWKLMELMIRWT